MRGPIDNGITEEGAKKLTEALKHNTVLTSIVFSSI